MTVFLPVSAARRVGRGDEQAAVVGDPVAQADGSQHVGEGVARGEAAPFERHRLVEVDRILGERRLVDLIAEASLGGDQPEHVLSRGAGDVDGDRPVERLVDAGADVGVAFGRDRLGFVFLALRLVFVLGIRVGRLEDRVGGFGLAFGLVAGLLLLVLGLGLGQLVGNRLLGNRRREGVEPADPVTSPLNGRDHRDVDQLLARQVLQRVLVGSAADLDRDRDGQLGVVGQKSLDPGLVLEVERAD